MLYAMVAVLGLLVAVTGAFLYLNRPASTQDAQGQVTANPSSSPKEQKSLKDLLALGQGQECSFTNENGGGTVYVGENKLRGDMGVTEGEQINKFHMLVDSETIYMWSEGEKTGFKMPVNGTPDTGSPQPGQNVDVNQKMDAECKAWSVDTSLFELPKGVTFTDLSKFKVPTPATGAGTQSQSSCAACNSLTGESKAQCLDVLNC